MPQLFPRWFDWLARAGLYGIVLAVPGIAVGLAVFYRSDYVTGEHVAYEQPVPFSHQHHVSQLGIDCRYCHTSVEESAFAGMPSTEICMNCHQQIWTSADTLAPVRESWRTGQPIRWTRVHNVPGFVHFHHGAHVSKGVGCIECHGRVDQMPLTWQDKPLTMEWCLACHRNPAHHLRPRDEVFNMTWDRSDVSDPGELGQRLMAEYEVRDANTLSSCSVCHH